MNNSPSRWNVAQIAICAGIVCIAVGFANNCVSVVYAQCANSTVREKSPCVTQATSCRLVGGVCPGEGTEVQFGNFQCDTPASGKTCIGSGKMAPCYDRSSCVFDTSTSNCRQDPDGEVEAVDAETQKETQCAG